MNHAPNAGLIARHLDLQSRELRRYWMNDWMLFQTIILLCNAIMGWGQPGLMRYLGWGESRLRRWIFGWNMPQMQAWLLHLYIILYCYAWFYTNQKLTISESDQNWLTRSILVWNITCPRCRIAHSTCWPAVQCTTTVLRLPPRLTCEDIDIGELWDVGYGNIGNIVTLGQQEFVLLYSVLSCFFFFWPKTQT